MAELSNDDFENLGVPPSVSPPSSPKILSNDEFEAAGSPSSSAATAHNDHGLAERQKLSLIEKAISPITGYPATYSKMKNEAVETLGHGVHQLASPESAWDFAKGVGNTALGAVEYVGSPINAAYRSVVGQPIEDVTGIPREYTEFATQLATPGLGLRALSPKVPGAIRGPSELQPSVAGATAVPEAESANELGIPLSRGQATRDLDAIRYEDMASRDAYGPKAQKEAVKFFDEQYKAIQAAGANVSETLGRNGPNIGDAGEAAAVINSELLSTAEKARAVVAEAERRAAAEVAAHEAASVNAGRTLDETVRAGRAPVQNVREAGETVGQGVRDAAETARQDYKGKYNEAFDLPGEFGVGTFSDIGRSIKNKLTNGESPVIVDDTTPISSRALDDLNKIQNLKLENKAHAPGTDVVSASEGPSEIVAVNLKGVDQARKLLVQRYQQAKAKGRATQDFSDQRGMERIIDAFDDHIEQSISNGLFSGDPRALTALQEARASFSNYRKTYRPNAGDDVSTALNRIVSRNATPEEIGNMIVGSGKIGSAGLPVRLAERLKTIFGEDSDQWSAIRQAIWQRASAVRNAAGEFDAARSANTLTDFTNTTLARKMFTPAELGAMRAHADGIRELNRLVETLPSSQIAKQAKGIYQQAFGGSDIGGSQATVFRRIMDGTATPQETTQAILGAVNSSSSGNVVRALKAIEKIVGPESDTMNAIRRGVWEKLTKNAIGKDQPGQQKIVQAVNEFLNGQGRMVAQQLYSTAELDLMKKYAEAVKMTVIPKYARTNSDTAPAILAAAHKYAGSIAAAIGELFGHGVFSAVTGYGVGKMLQSGIDKIKDMKELNRVRGQFEPPSAVKPLPKRGKPVSLPPNAPLMLTSPPRYPFLQSPSTAGANEDQRKIPRPPAQQSNGGQVNQVHSRGYADGGTPLADDAIDPRADQPPPVSSPQLETDEAQLAREAAAARAAHAAHPGQRQEGLLTRVPEMLADDIYRSGKKIVTGSAATLDALQRRYNPQEGDVLSDYEVSPEDIAAGTTAEAAGAIFPGYSGKLLQLPAREAVREVVPRMAQFAANATDKETAKGAVRNELARDVSDAGFYSHGAEAAQNLPQETGTPQQMRAMLEKQGVKKEEFDNANWDLVFGNQPKVSKQEVSTLFKDSMPPVQEVWHSGEHIEDAEAAARKWVEERFPDREIDSPQYNRLVQEKADELANQTKGTLRYGPETHEDYNTPGGTNHRELLLALPKGAERDTTRPDAAAVAKYGSEWDRIKAELEPFNKRFEVGDSTALPEINRLHNQLDDLHTKMIDETFDRVPENQKSNFKSSHWDEPNILAHVRMQDQLTGAATPEQIDDIGRRMAEAVGAKSEKSVGSGAPAVAVRKGLVTEAEAADWSRARGMRSGFEDKTGLGKKTLLVDELQSDWHQKGRQDGYQGRARNVDEIDRDTDAVRAELKRREPDLNEMSSASWQVAWDKHPDLYQLGNELAHERGANQFAVPNAPFKTTWPDLAMKRVLKHAADNGYDQVAWTSGKTQAERYDLSKHVDKIDYNPESGKLWGYDKNGAVAIDTRVPKDKLADHVGKDVADKLLASDSNKGWHHLTGTEIKVSAPGMEGFYDKILPSKVNALVKKHGAKVEQTELPIRQHDKSRFVSGQDIMNDLGIEPHEQNEYWRNLSAAQRERLDSAYRKKLGTETAEPIHVVPITPSLRDELRGGVRMFSNHADKENVARNEAMQSGSIVARRLQETKEFYNKHHGRDPSTEEFGIPLKVRAGQIARGMTEFNKTNPDETYAPREELRQIREYLRNSQKRSEGRAAGGAVAHPERQSSEQWDVELRAGGGPVAKRQNATLEQKKTFEAPPQRGSGENRYTGGSVPARATGGRTEESYADWRERIGWANGGPVPARAHGGRVEASNINHEPTDAQKHAGNYAKDHVHIFGLPITIENAKGSIRRGVGPDGKSWACVLPANYGYIKRSHGQDDDNLDVYLGPHTKSPHVFLVDQHDLRTGKMDEYKAMLGFGSQKQALACYEKAFSDGKGRARIGAVTTMTIPQFKEWLATESEKRTHASVDYVEMATDKDHCAICKHFIPGNPPACTGVKSPISAAGWCKRFKRG